MVWSFVWRYGSREFRTTQLAMHWIQGLTDGFACASIPKAPKQSAPARRTYKRRAPKPTTDAAPDSPAAQSRFAR